MTNCMNEAIASHDGNHAAAIGKFVVSVVCVEFVVSVVCVEFVVSVVCVEFVVSVVCVEFVHGH